jgi:hypothetical protein
MRNPCRIVGVWDIGDDRVADRFTVQSRIHAEGDRVRRERNMPFRNEHAARMKSPRAFQKRTFRSKSIGKGIRLIVAKKCSRCSMETQAVRFDVCRFSAAKARAWLKKHRMKPLKFEAASGVCERR